MADSTRAKAEPAPYINHVDDVAGLFGSCSDAFGQLEAILTVIAKHSDANCELTKLAGAGQYIANDFENLTDGLREQIERNGVRHG